MKRGFSLLEVIVAIFVIAIGVTGSLSLINYCISSAAIGKSQIIAANLAQEGLEIVRNIRDSNWLEDATWNDGLGEGEWRVQYDSLNLLASSSDNLLIDGDDFYQYATGSETLFEREITITSISVNQIKVISEVTWSERGRSFSISAEDRLYDWK